MTDLIWAATHESRAYDRAAHVKALRALPATWHAQAQARRPPLAPPRHRRAGAPRRRRRG